jgi:hypothetical protein
MPTTLRRLLLTLIFPALLLVVLATGAFAGGNNEKTTLCHVTGNGSYHQITVSVHAVPAHLAHGDVLPDEYGDCPS